MEPTEQKRSNRLKGWILLFSFSFLIWLFGAYIGPWIQSTSPTMQQIVHTIEERGIDSAAYFYTEIEASYEGERYLKEAMEMSDSEASGVGLSFIAGMAFCFILLALAFFFLPVD